MSRIQVLGPGVYDVGFNISGFGITGLEVLSFRVEVLKARPEGSRDRLIASAVATTRAPKP